MTKIHLMQAKVPKPLEKRTIARDPNHAPKPLEKIKLAPKIYLTQTKASKTLKKRASARDLPYAN